MRHEPQRDKTTDFYHFLAWPLPRDYSLAWKQLLCLFLGGHQKKKCFIKILTSWSTQIFSMTPEDFTFVEFCDLSSGHNCLLPKTCKIIPDPGKVPKQTPVTLPRVTAKMSRKFLVPAIPHLSCIRLSNVLFICKAMLIISAHEYSLSHPFGVTFCLGGIVLGHNPLPSSALHTLSLP